MNAQEALHLLLPLAKRAASFGVQVGSTLEQDLFDAIAEIEASVGSWGSCDPGDHYGFVQTVDTPHGPAAACEDCRGIAA